MSVVQAATGVSASLIADLENDEKDRKVNYIDVAKLAKHYGVTADWLCGISNDHHQTPCASNELGLSEKSIYSLKALADIPVLFDKMLGGEDQSMQESAGQRYFNLIKSLKCFGNSDAREDDNVLAYFMSLYVMDLIDFLINVVTEEYGLLCDYYDLRELNPVDWDDTVEHISFDDFVRFKAGEIAKVIDRRLVEEFRNRDAYFVRIDPEDVPYPDMLSHDSVNPNE